MAAEVTSLLWEIASAALEEVEAPATCAGGVAVDKEEESLPA
jgi:hypothetical protein